MKRNSKTLLTLFVCLLFISAIVCTAFFALKDKPTMKLIGPESLTVELGESYTEQGCLSFVGDVQIYNISTSGEVDTLNPGEYKITYTASYGSKTATVSRTVYVCDTTAPTITAPSEIELKIAEKLENAKFQHAANDNYDGDISHRITAKYEDETIILSVSDSSGNKAYHKIKVTRVKDTVMPEITLTGPVNSYLLYGEEYKEPGYVALDNIDGKITHKVTVSGDDEYFEIGNHYITYSVTDSSGNTTEVKRKIFVYDPNTQNAESFENSRVIFLTFDDGPCVYTPKVLQTLERYQIKATFFVTNQKSDWQDYIGEAFRKGHSIGAHTYSHKYEIYKSTEDYFNDLNAINEVIKQQTGNYTNLIRFPGGSSNTISKKYKKGIMSELVKEVTDKGYVYFDWNVVSGDADSTSKKNDPEYIFANVRDNLKSGANIVLMHDINPANLEALPMIIEHAITNGYTFLPLNENSPTAHHGVNN